MDRLEQYLDQVCRGVGGPKALRQHLRRELREHLRDAAAAHRTAGMSEEAALARALADFGAPDELGAELAATHGHRLLAVVIDRAMQWKEMTMRAKWLWAGWAYVAAVGVIALELVFISFSSMFLIPKLQKFKHEGWLDIDSEHTGAFVSWGLGFLGRVQRWSEGTLWWIVGAVAAWGLLEWRVRGENKPFVRLAALGTVAVALMVVVMFTAAALEIPMLLGLPPMAQISAPAAVKEMAAVDASVEAVERALARKDWEGMQASVDRATDAVRRLERVVGALPALTSEREQPTVEELRGRLRSAGQCLREAQDAIRGKDAARVREALRRFHTAYGRLGKAPPAPGG